MALQDAAKRRQAGKAQLPEETPNMGQIQKLIDSSSEGAFDQGQAPPGQGGYGGPGAAQFHEALSKAKSGVNEPGPPQGILRRMQREKILPHVKPDVADLAARYGVVPGATNF